jgi:DNA helicase-2/ATP-dependent DNA helicase PcrA
VLRYIISYLHVKIKYTTHAILPLMTPFETAYKRLNPAQKKAVDTIDGPVLVVAGPGSGKTQVLALRVAHILSVTDMRPSNVLCMTFTDSASHNMRERLITFMGEDAYRVSIHTFHNLCTAIISGNPEYFYNGATLRAADEVTKYNVIEQIIESMPYDARLRSKHPEQGYTYLRSVQQVIGFIKKAGLTPDDFKKVLDRNDQDIVFLNEQLGPILEKTVTAAVFEELVASFEKLHEEKGNKAVLTYHSLIDALYYNLKTSVKEKADLSAWKTKHTEKNTKGEREFKETKRADILREVHTVYEQYSKNMYDQGYYDFDDMILDVLKALEAHPTLRYKLQEQYQYILVDEFQDTNDAQMKIIWQLTNNEVSEGRPNIMAVGDDDQAVYKFQGAELSNIVEFTKMYRDVEIVTLTENYRSNSEIVDSALSMIRQGSHRLENILEGFSKNLSSGRPFDGKNKLKKLKAIDSQEFDTKLHEYAYIADEIRSAMDNGVEAEDIAVISRNHRELVELVPYLQAKQVPIRYEREQHVLTEPHIMQIVTILRYAHEGLAADHDSMLPKILSYPFWGIDTLDIWKHSRTAFSERKSWQDVEDVPARVKIALTELLEITRLATHENAEHVIDHVIHKTGLRDFYFNTDTFTHEKSEYLVFLSSLRTFVQAVREYKQGKELSVADVITFVDTYENNNLILSDTSPFVNARNAVNLLTAHKSKGLEFEVVFIVSATDKQWTGGGHAGNVKLPQNLPLAPAGDEEDDWLRLFFVAITRAKNHLYITSHRADGSGKKAHMIRFMESLGLGEREQAELPEVNATSVLESSVLSADRKHMHISSRFLDTEKALLDTLTKDHVLSITHVNNFLNVGKGGPIYFMENNLLRFPQAKTASAGFGTALHAVLSKALVCFKKEKKHAPLEKVKEWFTEFLIHERLSKADYALQHAKGMDVLPLVYQEKILTFRGDECTEVDFKHEGVVLGGKVPVSGKIDLIRFVEEGDRDIYVCDYKTGKEKKSWTGKTPIDKIQLHFNRQQLIFYKILIQKSKNYSKYTVTCGQLEFLQTTGESLAVLSTEITDDEMHRLERLVVAIHGRIQEHDFTVPEHVLELKDLEAIEAFEEYLLEGKYS